MVKRQYSLNRLILRCFSDAALIDYRYLLFAEACRLYALASRLPVDCNPCVLFKLVAHVEYETLPVNMLAMGGCHRVFFT